MISLSILGSTGSIGTQTLEVVNAFPDKFSVSGLAAHRCSDRLVNQIATYTPDIVSVGTSQDADALSRECQAQNLNCEIVWGQPGLETVATHSHTQFLVVAIPGTASLFPTYQAIKAGIPIGLATKEVLVSAGKLIMNTARHKHVPILPIDSEHAAIKQCLESVNEDISKINRIILTASGGPFRTLPITELSTVTPEQALKHPNWDMGAKVTIDSATLFNKGLEVIEAHHLFDIPFDQIEVLVHPQSMVHAMVELCDGNILSHTGPPDMRYPIQYALTYPEKWPAPWPKTTVDQLQTLEFQTPDTTKFPLLALAYEAGKIGGTAPAIINAANEIAVSLFLDHKIGFTDIQKIVETTLNTTPSISSPTLDDILGLDAQVKEHLLYAHR